jgi:hypothetical protein
MQVACKPPPLDLGDMIYLHREKKERVEKLSRWIVTRAQRERG